MWNFFCFFVTTNLNNNEYQFIVGTYQDSGTTYSKPLKLSAKYIQGEGLSWESYRWILLDKDGNILTHEIPAVFVAIGQVPDNKAFSDYVDIDQMGYIVSDENCLTETEGLFVAGDCRTKKIRQVTTAAADGAVAALAACRYIDGL